MPGAPNPEPISTGLQRVATLAKQAPELAFKTLAHHLTLDSLKEAYQRTRRDAAPGVDGQTWEQYGQNLEQNLQNLLNRAKSGSYRAPPVKRVYIPKEDGQTRALGLPTLEDKVLQRAVATVLEAVYEQDFLPCSYGYRPGKSAHQALESIWQQVTGLGGGWVLEVDIKQYFDSLQHPHLKDLLGLRVRDGVLLRLISKWLHAGVWEAGELSYPEAGTPQGGVISPLLANVYLHYVLDVWFAKEVQPRLKGKCFLVRYADDFLMGFQYEEDARRVLAVLPARFGKYGLTLHPEKTRLVKFQPPRTPDQEQDSSTFDFLAFTHYWGKSRYKKWVVKRKTAKKRLARALKRLWAWCHKVMHWPLKEQHRRLCRKLQGHYNYFGLTGNSPGLRRFFRAARRGWKASLARRSDEGMTWEKFELLEKRYRLPPPKVVHSVFRLA